MSDISKPIDPAGVTGTEPYGRINKLRKLGEKRIADKAEKVTDAVWRQKLRRPKVSSRKGSSK